MNHQLLVTIHEYSDYVILPYMEELVETGYSQINNPTLHIVTDSKLPKSIHIRTTLIYIFKLLPLYGNNSNIGYFE